MKGDADEQGTGFIRHQHGCGKTGIMNNTGYPAFNYDVFKRMYDDGRANYKNVVADFDQREDSDQDGPTSRERSSDGLRRPR
jgi:hypothetical protein